MSFSLFARLLVLRANPQDLPADARVLAIALAAHVIADVLALLDTMALAPALFAAALDTVLLVALAHTALLLRGFGARALQTIAALAGTGALLSLLHWLLSSALLFDSPLVLGLPFLGWFLAVYAHILREALSISYAAALGASLVYIILSLGVAGIVLPPPVEAP
ncbi:MAG: hypothetical protein ACLGHO_03075 [Gammaproteobacteria bacterium]